MVRTASVYAIGLVTADAIDPFIVVAKHIINGNPYPEIITHNTIEEVLPSVMKVKDRLFMLHGILFHRGGEDNALKLLGTSHLSFNVTRGQRVIPRTLVKSTFIAFHASGRGGHVGRDATYQKISERYWWTDMHKDITRWVAQCDRCQRSKSGTSAAPLRRMLPVMKPFERAHARCDGTTTSITTN